MTQSTIITQTQYRITMGVLIFLVLAGCGLLAFGAVFLLEANASRGWPSVQGEVQNVRVVWDRNTSGATKGSYHYVVTYAYLVNDQLYSGDRYSLGSGSTASKKYPERGEARAASREEYPVGSAVEVYYNPADPASAVLNPGANWGTYMPLLMGLIFIPGGIILMHLIRRNYKNSAHSADISTPKCYRGDQEIWRLGDF